MNKKTIALILLLAGICLLCAVCVWTAVPGGKSTKAAEFCSGEGGQLAVRVFPGWQEETIRPYVSGRDGIYYFFLPSALCGRTIRNRAPELSLAVGGQPLENGAVFEWEEGETYQISFGGAEPVPVKFMLSSPLPSLFITSQDGLMLLPEKGNEVTDRGTLLVVEADGTVSFGGSLTLKGRGNSSWYLFGKRPFNLKLDKAARILGMEKDKGWCLLANSWDYSYMNNKLALDMASGAGFSYVPDAEYADVYFDGDYLGVYLVTEKAEVDKNRIDITDLGLKNREMNLQKDPAAAKTFDFGSMRGIHLDSIPADLTGGYLIERDYRVSPDYPGRILPPSYFETESGTSFRIRVPEYADIREVEYIRRLVSRMEDAILSESGISESGESYLDYIDLSSWVRSYLVAEIAYDPDKDITNAFYYKDTDRRDPLIRMGPVWDYDNRFGGKEEFSSPEVMSGLSPKGWLVHLLEKPEFQDAVIREWNAFFRDYLQKEAPAKIRHWQEKIRQSVRMDNVRWFRGPGYPVRWPSTGEIFTDEYDFDSQVDYLQSWLEARCAFLDLRLGAE